MRNFKIKVEYNGSGFYGWQKQDGKRTIQGDLETAVFKLTGEKTTVEGSGRTDRGVHSLGQIASFKLETKIPLKNMKVALNNLLPEDIMIKQIALADENFHARFSAKRKTYQYKVQVGGERNAIKNALLAFYPYKVDIEKMNSAAKLLLGKHDFRGFCSSNAQVKNFEREIYFLSIKKSGNVFTFEVCGNGFLYNMVRIIVGTLLEVGRGRLSENDVLKALAGDRKSAGIVMPACGLYLKNVEYI